MSIQKTTPFLHTFLQKYKGICWGGFCFKSFDLDIKPVNHLREQGFHASNRPSGHEFLFVLAHLQQIGRIVESRRLVQPPVDRQLHKESEGRFHGRQDQDRIDPCNEGREHGLCDDHGSFPMSLWQSCEAYHKPGQAGDLCCQRYVHDDLLGIFTSMIDRGNRTRHHNQALEQHHHMLAQVLVQGYSVIGLSILVE